MFQAYKHLSTTVHECVYICIAVSDILLYASVVNIILIISILYVVKIVKFFSYL